MIEKFLDNTQVPVCGAKLFIYMKRYPNETDFSVVADKLRQHHATILVFTSNNPSGGHQPRTVYELATVTHGICIFDYDYRFTGDIYDIISLHVPYLVYSANADVHGTGSITLPPLTIPTKYTFKFEITEQDHGPLDTFRSLKLGWYNKNSNLSSTFIEDAKNKLNTGTYMSNWFSFDAVEYNITLDYDYSGSRMETLQIRLYSFVRFNNWGPLSH